MHLRDALDIRRGDLVAFVGAGGKTSGMFRLAAELAESGWRVVTTTTTRLAVEELAEAPGVVALEGRRTLPDDFTERLEAERHLFVYDTISGKDRLRGLEEGWVGEVLAAHPAVDVVLVEADGARMRSFKAPYDHEPAMPPAATLVVFAIGLDLLGEPLDEEHVYGWELIAARLGVTEGATITPALMAAVAADPAMGMKRVPSGGRQAVLLNKANPDRMAAARATAAEILAIGGPQRVLIASTWDADPVLELRRPVSAVVLAAGRATRMGGPKLVLPWQGQPMIRGVCREALASDVRDVLVVTGGWRGEVEAALADVPVRLTHNPDHATGGMLSSLGVGLRALPDDAAAALVVLGDQPTVQHEVIDRLLTAYAEGRGPIVVPVYEGRRGHPVLIDRSLWGDLHALPAGGAPRDLLSAHEETIVELEVASPSILHDIDTPADYEAARRQLGD